MTVVILMLASKGPCVILGRCADAILDEANVDSLNVFIYASAMSERVDRVRKLDGVENSHIEAYIRKKDNQRRNYNKFFTQEVWGERQNYDLMLNTSAFGYEGAAKLILAAME